MLTTLQPGGPPFLNHKDPLVSVSNYYVERNQLLLHRNKDEVVNIIFIVNNKLYLILLLHVHCYLDTLLLSEYVYTCAMANQCHVFYHIPESTPRLSII